MMFRVCYEIVTPESAENGDVAEQGFVTPGEWRWNADTFLDGPAMAMTLREAMQLCYPVEESGYWWSGEPVQDYRTGAWERRSIHPPENITASSYGRVARLLGL